MANTQDEPSIDEFEARSDVERKHAYFNQNPSRTAAEALVRALWEWEAVAEPDYDEQILTSVYRDADGREITARHQRGFIMPPAISVHVPLTGPAMLVIQ